MFNMGKINTFIHVLKKTFTSPLYYKEILKAPFSFSLKFFIFYFFLFSIISTLFISINFLSKTQSYIRNLPAMLIEAYPEELEVKVRNGEVSTNVKEPYKMSVKEVEKVFEENKDNVLGAKEEDLENILVIDTSGSMEDFEKYKTAVLITKKNIMYVNDQGRYETFPLSEVGDVTINRSMVETFVGSLAPFLNLVFPGLVLFVFIGAFIFIPLGKMTYLLFFALVLWIIAKLMKYVLSFGKAYQMGLHLVVITTTLFGLLSLIKVNITFPFLQTILLSVLSIVILSKIKGNETAVTTQNH